MNTKAKGARAEHKTIRLLEAAGYHATRSAASLGSWDVIAIGSTDIVLVQVKTGRAASPAERQELKEFECPPNCRKLIHVWMPRKKLPMVIEI